MSLSRSKFSYNIDYDPDRDVQPENQAATPHVPESTSQNLPEQKKEKEYEWPAIIRFFIDKRTHAFIGVLLILFSAYLVMAALSYITSAADDQSKVNQLTVTEMVSEPIPISNITGPAGATAAHFLLTRSMGIGSLVLVVYLFLLGLFLIGIKKKLHFWSLTLKCLFTAISISLIAGLADIYLNSENVYPLGGYHGRFVNLWLIDRIQWIGTLCIGIALLAAITFIYLYDIVKISRRVKEAYRVAFPAKAAQIENPAETNPDNESTGEQAEHSAYMPTGATENKDETTVDEPYEPEMMPISVNFEDEKTDIESSNGLLAAVTDAITLGSDNEELPDKDNKETTQESPVDERTAEDIPEEHLGYIPMFIKTAAYESHPADLVHGPVENYETPESDEAEAKKISEEKKFEQDNVHTPFDERVDSQEIKPEEMQESEDKTGFNISVSEIEIGEEDTSELYDPTAELSRYERPSLDRLINRVNKSTSVDLEEQEENKEQIIKTLKNYGIGISQISATIGPTVTLYEIIPSEGVRIAKIKRLEDDIALSLAAKGIRIIAPIPGKGTIGIEVPNKEPQVVSMRSVLASKAFQTCKYELPMAMGATISNDIYIADLAKMPHLLVAGATGQGKSVGLNAIIASLLYKKHPSELKLVLVDPKMVEFSLYSRLKYHFMAQLDGEEDAVITDMDKVEKTLNSLCVEMDNRYNLLKDAGVRSLLEYNEKFSKRRLNPEKGHRYLPYIVIIVDEFADLIMTSGKAIETPIARIAQKARAVGMHMIIATQRPSTNVITGIIKANFPGRIAFKVSQMVDSKTILDRTGANQLIGRGDMLFSHNGSMERVQCAFIDTPEVDAIVESISSQVGFGHPYILPEPPAAEGEITIGSITDRDPLFDDAARFLCSGGDTASTSSLQRQFSIGYNRAGRIMDQLESAGIVSAAQGSKPRNILVDIFQLDEILNANKRL